MIEVDVHPEFAAHGSFEHLRLGRTAPRHDSRTLRLATYLDDAVILPDVPAEADYTVGVPVWPMYGNDRLGDCTLATVGHLIQGWTTAIGASVTPGDAAIERSYWETGTPPSETGEPGGPTDTGRMEVDVLNYWRQTGVGGDKIVAYAYVDPKNLAHVKAAIWLFGGVYIGVALPKTAQGQQVWDVVPNAGADGDPGSWGGHAVPYVGYGVSPLAATADPHLRLITWGAVLDMTEAFHSAYVDEIYAPISADFLNAKGASPQGFDLTALQADLQALQSAQTHFADTGGAPDSGTAANAKTSFEIDESSTVTPDGFTWAG